MKYLEHYRMKNRIKVEGKITNFKPIETFDESYFSKDFLEVTKHFKEPTPVQAQCWPIILLKHDVIGVAQTGSGKTLAFGLPLLKHLTSKKDILEQKEPSVLILSPTRELSNQTATVMEAAGKQSEIKVVNVFGGVSIGPQIQKIRNGVHILIATPGRLLDLYNQGACPLGNVEYLVLDEADTMLDMGFEKDIRAILQYIKPLRQTLMFTATWPTNIQKIAEEYLTNPIKVVIGADQLAANHNIRQIVEVIESDERANRLLELLKEYHHSKKNKIIIFVLYKREATWIENFLKRNRWIGVSIHSDKNQSQRNRAITEFKNGTTPLLIATDVAARGLDIPQVEYVINYSFPLTVEQYVHRIGRTGRAGAMGTAHTFFQKADKSLSGGLVNILKEAKQQVPESLLKFGTAVKKVQPALGKINTGASNPIFF